MQLIGCRDFDSITLFLNVKATIVSVKGNSFLFSLYNDLFQSIVLYKNLKEYFEEKQVFVSVRFFTLKAVIVMCIKRSLE
jgi:hypothetical protein